MRIAVCDDDIYFIKKIEKYIYLYSKSKKEPVLLSSYTTGFELMENCGHNQSIDVIFLDVLLGRENGVDIAKKIRENNSNVIIVFISSVEKYAVSGYDVNAFHYLLKPVTYSKFVSVVKSVEQELSKRKTDFFGDKTNLGMVLIRYYELCYIETYERNTIIHTTNGDYISYRTMKEHDRILNDVRFYRCHAAYIINMQYVYRVQGLSIFLKQGNEILISKNRKSKFMLALTEYIDGMSAV
ncbi:MAG: LytTR family DNA-binding domain-containing protein [Hespellia sp.]|nr:LytTR family DNA-binding domain-containing protein [Hespellia sp.]